MHVHSEVSLFKVNGTHSQESMFRIVALYGALLLKSSEWLVCISKDVSHSSIDRSEKALTPYSLMCPRLCFLGLLPGAPHPTERQTCEGQHHTLFSTILVIYNTRESTDFRVMGNHLKWLPSKRLFLFYSSSFWQQVGGAAYMVCWCACSPSPPTTLLMQRTPVSLVAAVPWL